MDMHHFRASSQVVFSDQSQQSGLAKKMLSLNNAFS